jgi:hypothetical protein
MLQESELKVPVLFGDDRSHNEDLHQTRFATWAVNVLDRLESVESESEEEVNILKCRIIDLEKNVNKFTLIMREVNIINGFKKTVDIEKNTDCPHCRDVIFQHNTFLKRLQYLIYGGNALKSTADLLHALAALLRPLSSERNTADKNLLNPINIEDILKAVKVRAAMLNQAADLIQTTLTSE